MNMNLRNQNLHLQEKKYLKENREKILSLWRELRDTWEISQEQFEATYFKLFIKNHIK